MGCSFLASLLMFGIVLGKSKAIECPSGYNETIACENGMCSSEESEGCALLCSGDSTCRESTFLQSIVECQTRACQDSAFRQATVACIGEWWSTSNMVCQNSNFVLSNVTCEGHTGCQFSQFERSQVDCTNTGACESAQFEASAVQGCSDVERCGTSTFLRCSCCDGDGCPDGVLSCTDEGFCSSVYLEKTCEEWGNPICGGNLHNIGHTGIAVVENVASSSTPNICQTNENFPITICNSQLCSNEESEGCALLCSGKSTCQKSAFLQSIVECQDQACQDSDFRQATVACHGEWRTTNTSVCQNSHFILSNVTCIGHTGCQSSQFERSRVDCTNSGACDNSMFEASAVQGCSNNKCLTSKFLRCSCCDGDTCPGGVPLCSDEGFCSSVYLGKTCQEWGNPFCGENFDNIGHSGIKVVDNVANSTSPTTCQTDEDFPITKCNPRKCSNAELEGCAILCSGNNTCSESTFLTSIVECKNLACQDSDFRQSTVACNGELWTSGNFICQNSTFAFSNVTCTGQSGCHLSQFVHSQVDCTNTGACEAVLFETSAVQGCSRDEMCGTSTFVRCSCCDGYGCPHEVPSCSDEGFCSSVYLGKTCEEWGNPICGSNMLSIGHLGTEDSSTAHPTTLSPTTPQPTVPSVSWPSSSPSIMHDTTSKPSSPTGTSLVNPTSSPSATIVSTEGSSAPAKSGGGSFTETIILTEVTTKNTAISIDLLAGSDDKPGDVSIVDPPLNGGILIGEEDEVGQITYVPHPDFVGREEFSVLACQTGEEGKGTCTIITTIITVEPSEPSDGSNTIPVWNICFVFWLLSILFGEYLVPQ